MQDSNNAEIMKHKSPEVATNKHSLEKLHDKINEDELSSLPTISAHQASPITQLEDEIEKVEDLEKCEENTQSANDATSDFQKPQTIEAKNNTPVSVLFYFQKPYVGII